MHRWLDTVVTAAETSTVAYLLAAHLKLHSPTIIRSQSHIDFACRAV